MRIEEKDIFIEADDPKIKKTKSREIKLKISSVLGTSSKTIRLSYKSGYLIVQTDKPLYTPRENGKNFQTTLFFCSVLHETIVNLGVTVAYEMLLLYML